MESADASLVDASYCERCHFDKKTLTTDRRHIERFGTFVCSYLKHPRVPVRRVLDVGCGIGLWRDIVARHFPQASYHGVEIGDYRCKRHGRERGSVVDHPAPYHYHVVICQGVLACPNPADLEHALRNPGSPPATTSSSTDDRPPVIPWKDRCITTIHHHRHRRASADRAGPVGR